MFENRSPAAENLFGTFLDKVLPNLHRIDKVYVQGLSLVAVQFITAKDEADTLLAERLGTLLAHLYNEPLVLFQKDLLEVVKGLTDAEFLKEFKELKIE